MVSDVHFIYAGNRREPILLAEKPLHGLAEKLRADLRDALTANGVFVQCQNLEKEVTKNLIF